MRVPVKQFYNSDIVQLSLENAAEDCKVPLIALTDAWYDDNAW